MIERQGVMFTEKYEKNAQKRSLIDDFWKNKETENKVMSLKISTLRLQTTS